MIGDDDQNDTDQSSIPQAKLKYVYYYSFLYFFSSTFVYYNRPDRLIITTTGKGHFLDTSEEKRLQRSEADLLVYFNAIQFFSVNIYLYRYMCFFFLFII